MIKLGIIGYGGMACWHVDRLAKTDGITAVAAYDIDSERVALAKKNGLKAYSTLKEFLADKDINLVLVATPNDVHRELCVAAMNAGKNVICEKPVAMNEVEVDEMIAAANKNKVLFTVHQNRRWDTDFRVVKKIFDEGMIGKVFNIESRLHGTGGECHGWRGVKKQGGGMLYDWGVHLIDQILQMVPDQIVQIYCQQFSIKNNDCDDYFKLVIKYKGGLSCLVEVGTYCARGLPRWYANGDKGAVTVDNFDGKAGGITSVKSSANFTPVIIETAAGPTRTFAPQPPETLTESALPEVQSDLCEYYENIKDVLGGKAVQIVKHKEIKRVMRVIDTAFKSAAQGRSLDFKEV